MSRVSYTEVDAQPDPLDQVHYRLFFPRIPGATLSTQTLEINTQTAVWAGSSNEVYEVTRHGWTKSYRGRATWPRTLSLAFVELSNAGVTKLLKGWKEETAGSESNNSQGFSNEYKVTAILEIYDTTGEVAHTQTFEGLMIQEVQDTNMDGSASGQVLINATFKYDRVGESDIPVL